MYAPAVVNVATECAFIPLLKLPYAVLVPDGSVMTTPASPPQLPVLIVTSSVSPAGRVKEHSASS